MLEGKCSERHGVVGLGCEESTAEPSKNRAPVPAFTFTQVNGLSAGREGGGNHGVSKRFGLFCLLRDINLWRWGVEPGWRIFVVADQKASAQVMVAFWLAVRDR